MPGSKVEVLVLGLLAEEPLHGYDVLERIRARSIGLWAAVGRASVYQALHRLERDGFVSGRAQEGGRGPDRRVFKITRTGRARLRGSIGELAGELDPFETGAGLALGFAHLLPAGERKAVVEARERALEALLEALRAGRAGLAGPPGEPGEASSGAMLDRQRALVEAELAWIRRPHGGIGKIHR
ncbi:MAG: helix-turn-helix transcriptional regulator [Actinobacteria bacterium]|nr:helix-turn-helix transcriptional regulator [Actinomycetota bacterium]